MFTCIYFLNTIDNEDSNHRFKCGRTLCPERNEKSSVHGKYFVCSSSCGKIHQGFWTEGNTILLLKYCFVKFGTGLRIFFRAANPLMRKLSTLSQILLSVECLTTWLSVQEAV